MVETIDIGPGPCDEQCAQIGAPDFAERNRAECRAFINQIRRVMGEPPEGVSLFMKGNLHDFGTYREVVAKVSGIMDEEAREKALEYAYGCESGSPATWDDEARMELAAAGFPVPVEA